MDLVTFYHNVEQFQTRIGAIQSVLDNYNKGGDATLDRNFIINTFKKTIGLWKNRAVGENVVSQIEMKWGSIEAETSANHKMHRTR